MIFFMFGRFSDASVTFCITFGRLLLPDSFCSMVTAHESELQSERLNDPKVKVTGPNVRDTARGHQLFEPNRPERKRSGFLYRELGVF